MTDFKDLSKDLQEHTLDKLLRRHLPGYYESSVICELDDYLENKDVDNKAKLIISVGLVCKRLEIWMEENPEIKLEDAITMIKTSIMDYPRNGN